MGPISKDMPMPQGDQIKQLSEKVETTSIHSLPMEMLSLVLSHLHAQDSKAAASVSKSWNAATIEAKKMELVAAFKDYIKFIEQNLPEESSIVPQLEKLIADRKILGSANLIQLKSNFIEVENEIVMILKTLDKEKLEEIREKAEGTPHALFNEILLLAACENAFDTAGQMDDEEPDYQKSNCLKEVAAQVGNLQYFDRAMEIASQIPEDLYRSAARGEVLKCMAKSNENEKADEAINSFPESERDAARRDFGLGLLEHHDLEEAFKVAKQIQNQLLKDSLLKPLTEELRSLGFLDQALEAALLTSKTWRDDLLEDIARAFGKVGKTEKAVSILNMIDMSDEFKQEVIEEIQEIQTSEEEQNID